MMKTFSPCFLFVLANESKDMREYAPANLAWACLHQLSINNKSYSWQWEHGDYPDRREHGQPTYYDLAIISLGDESLCIPAPFLSAETERLFLAKAEQVGRREHNRPYKKVIDSVAKSKRAIAQIVELFPSAWEYAQTIFDNDHYRRTELEAQGIREYETVSVMNRSGILQVPVGSKSPLFQMKERKA